MLQMSLLQIVGGIHAEESIPRSSGHVEAAQERGVQRSENIRGHVFQEQWSRRSDHEVIAVENQNRIVPAVEASVER
jgi:hypothetical protein